MFARAIELSNRIGQPQQVFASMYGNWAFIRAGHLRGAPDLTESLEFARQHGDPEVLMEALKMRGQTMLYRADFAGARDMLAKAVLKYDDPKRPKYWNAYTSQDPAVANRCHLAVSLWHLGFPDQARRTNREMRQLAREMAHLSAWHTPCTIQVGCTFVADSGPSSGRSRLSKLRFQPNRVLRFGTLRVRFSRALQCCCKVIRRKRCPYF